MLLWSTPQIHGTIDNINTFYGVFLQPSKAIEIRIKNNNLPFNTVLTIHSDALFNVSKIEGKNIFQKSII